MTGIGSYASSAADPSQLHFQYLRQAASSTHGSGPVAPNHGRTINGNLQWSANRTPPDQYSNKRTAPPRSPGKSRLDGGSPSRVKPRHEATTSGGKSGHIGTGTTDVVPEAGRQKTNLQRNLELHGADSLETWGIPAALVGALLMLNSLPGHLKTKSVNDLLQGPVVPVVTVTATVVKPGPGRPPTESFRCSRNCPELRQYWCAFCFRGETVVATGKKTCAGSLNKTPRPIAKSAAELAQLQAKAVRDRGAHNSPQPMASPKLMREATSLAAEAKDLWNSPSTNAGTENDSKALAPSTPSPRSTPFPPPVAVVTQTPPPALISPAPAMAPAAAQACEANIPPPAGCGHCKGVLLTGSTVQTCAHCQNTVHGTCAVATALPPALGGRTIWICTSCCQQGQTHALAHAEKISLISGNGAPNGGCPVSNVAGPSGINSAVAANRVGHTNGQSGATGACSLTASSNSASTTTSQPGSTSEWGQLDHASVPGSHPGSANENEQLNYASVPASAPALQTCGECCSGMVNNDHVCSICHAHLHATCGVNNENSRQCSHHKPAEPGKRQSRWSDDQNSEHFANGSGGYHMSMSS